MEKVNEVIQKERLKEYAYSYSAKQYKQKIPLPAENKSYVIYARKSSEGEDKQAKSIEDQIKECQEYARKNGLNVVDIIEESKSARYSGKRIEFTAMLEGIKSKEAKYNAILAWHPDRLSRNMLEAGQILDLLDQNVIADLKFVSYSFSNDMSGKMALGIQFVFAKQFTDSISVNTRRGVSHRFLTGQLPIKSKLGYTWKGDRIEVDSTFSELKTVWTLVASGATLRDVYKFVATNEHLKDIPLKRIRRMLVDPFYVGYSTQSGDIYDLTLKKGYIPMVDVETFFKVINILSVNKKPRLLGRLVPFRHLLCCAYCGKEMRVDITKKKNKDVGLLYARCLNKNCEWKKLPGKKQIRGLVVLEFLQKFLEKELRITPEFYRRVVSGLDRLREVKIADLELKKKEFVEHTKELDSLKSSLTLLTGDPDPKIAKSSRTDLSKTIEEIEQITKEYSSIDREVAILKAKEENLISYENFANFFENVRVAVNNQDNIEVIHKAAEMIFANLFVDNEKVQRFELKGVFKTLLDIKKDNWGG